MNSNGFYCFPVEIMLGLGVPGQVLIAFAGIGSANQDDCGEAISRALNEGLPPDFVVISVPKGRGVELSEIEAGTPLHAALDRGASVREFVVAEYDATGRFSKTLHLRGPVKLSARELNRLRASIIAAGLANLLTTPGGIPRLLIRAPAGHLFTKPSQRASNYFIRAENVVSHTEEMAFVAYCLLEWVAECRHRHGTAIRQIFVDSMSIGVVALVLAELLRQLGVCDPVPRVESFGSYEGLKSPNFYLPLAGTYVVIISATTSGGLAREWVEQCGCDPRDVATLFALPSAKPRSQILCVVQPPRDLIVATRADQIEGRREIHVVGEHFLQQPATTKSVQIGQVHESGIADGEFYEMQSAKVFDCHRYDPALFRERAIFLDGRRLSDVESFQSWLRDAVSKLVPASTVAIVYQDDNGSRRIAARCQEQLVHYGLGGIQIISLRQLRQRRRKSINGNVLVVAGVISRGSLLLEVSQILRDVQIQGGRTYLVGLQMCPCVDDAERLQSNLCNAPGSHKYTFAAFRQMYVGRVNQTSSWEQETNFVRPGLLKRIPTQVRDRLEKLEKTGNGLGEFSFWPSTSDQGPLALRPGFVFWRRFRYSVATQPAVFLTISSVLQAARSLNRLADDQRLSSTIFQPVVISPSTFGRFNDGVIQASLLRAAYPSELDYSAADELSLEMLVIVSDTLRRSATSAGEAASEFAMALLLKRLRLTKKHEEQLRVTIRNILPSVKDRGLAHLLKAYRAMQ